MQSILVHIHRMFTISHSLKSKMFHNFFPSLQGVIIENSLELNEQCEIVV